MARRRRSRVGRVYTRARKSYRSYSRKQSSALNPISALGYGAAYGAVITVANPWIQKVPSFAGQYTGPIVRAAVSYGLTKMGNANLRKLGIAGLTVEGAGLGAQLAAQSGLAGMITGTASSGSSNPAYS
jgi:hypothetical protein